MTTLMMRGNVLKSFSQAYMKKKAHPHEISLQGAKSEINTSSKREEKKNKIGSNLPKTIAYELQEKKLEIEMRLAY